MECEEELCPECTEHHKALKATRNHHVVDLKLKTSYASLLTKSTLVCEQHKDCDVEYFCVDHDELCCRECLAKTHKSCVNTMSLWPLTPWKFHLLQTWCFLELVYLTYCSAPFLLG
jgi:hypothetical protein